MVCDEASDVSFCQMEALKVGRIHLNGADLLLLMVVAVMVVMVEAVVLE